MEIVQHIYQSKLPFTFPKTEDRPATAPFFKSRTQQPPAYSNTDLISRTVPDANVYLIEGPEGNMLIDSGSNTADAYNALGTDLKNYGFVVKDIKQIIITHAHPDHTGLATKIASFSGASISISEAEATDLRARYEKYDEFVADNLKILIASGVPPQEASQLNHMLPREFLMPVNAATFLKEGDKIIFDPFEFDVIETPGHSPGHICLYEPRKRFLFSGDTVLQEITPNIGYSPQYGKDMLGEFIKSLEKLYPLEVNLVFPGHGPAFSGMRQLIEALMRHHNERQRLIKNTLEGNSKTPYQVAQEISWNVDVKDGKYEYMSVLDRRLAVTETVAHLEHMVNEKEIGKMEENGVNVYFA